MLTQEIKEKPDQTYVCIYFYMHEDKAKRIVCEQLDISWSFFFYFLKLIFLSNQVKHSWLCLSARVGVAF